MIESLQFLVDQLDYFVEVVLLPYGIIGLFLLSFFNSSILPVPTEVVLIPLVLLEPEQAILFGAVATSGSVLGAGFGYHLGLYGRGIKYFVNDRHFYRTQEILQEHGIIVVGVAGISPLPFKLFCIGAGVFRLHFFKIIGISILFRGFRFFSIAILLALYGEYMVRILNEWLWLATFVIGIIVILLYSLSYWLLAEKLPAMSR